MKILVLTKRQYTGKDLLDDRFGRLREIPLELARLGHEVMGVCLSYRQRQEGFFRDLCGDNGGYVAWYSMNLGKFILPGFTRYFLKTRRLIRQFGPDLIWACSDSFHVLLGVWLARRFNIKCVADLYDNFESFSATGFPGVQSLFKSAVRTADGVSCVSNPLARYVVENYGRRGPVLVLENGIRPDLFHPQDRNACRQLLGLPAKAKIIGTAGALHRNRGIHTLFQGFRLLAAHNPDIHLAVAGPRNSRTRIPNGPGVHDLGVLPLERVPYLVNALDVAVICNRDSSFGRYSFPQKAYEIIACRVPLVAARVGSMKDLLADHPECLFEPEHPESLAKVIRQQLAAPTALNIDVPAWADEAQKLEAFFTRMNG